MTLATVEKKLKGVKGRRKETIYEAIHSGQVLDTFWDSVTGFVGWLDVRCDRRVKDDTKVSVLSNYKNGVVIYRNGEGWGPQDFWFD